MDCTSSPPSRVELRGNHTDSNAGVVLPAALDLGIFAESRRLDGGQAKLTGEGMEGGSIADAAS